METNNRNNAGSRAEMYRQGIAPYDARQKLNCLLGEACTLLVTSKDGHEARLNRDSIGKMLSNSAVKKSVDNGFTSKQHFAVVSDIENVYSNSVKVSSSPDRHGYPDVTIHRLAVPLHFDNGAAYITVKETLQGGNRVHSLELIEIGRLERTLGADGVDAGQPSVASRPNTSTNKITSGRSKVNS